MNTDVIKQKLEQLYPLSSYPGRKIIVIGEGKTQEIICEFEEGKAMVVLGRSIPHYHKETTEIYDVKQGDLYVYKNDTSYFLSRGEKITISPDIIHYAVGNNAWVLVTSDPPWKQEDHFLVTHDEEV